MREKLVWALVTLFIILVSHRGDRSFVGSAPVGENAPPPPSSSDLDETQLDISDADVRQLESLKHSIGKTLAMMKSQSSIYTDINGHKDTHASTREEVTKDGDLVARISQQLESHANGRDKPTTKVRTDVDIPEDGIHKSIIEDNSNDEQPQLSFATSERTAAINSAAVVPAKERRQYQIHDNIRHHNNNAPNINLPEVQDINNNVDIYSTYSTGVQYSPLDMAEYVFWTGDEKGVTSSIQEFLRDGLMTHDEAIAFLEEIKFNLEYLQAHYSQQGVHSPDAQRLVQSKERAFNIQKNAKFGLTLPATQDDQPSPTKHIYDISDLRKDIEKKSSNFENGPTKQSKIITAAVSHQNSEDTISDEEYEILLERLRVADFLYTQYSLEEVIYQLAKVMFSQSLTRGSAEAQEALQKFTTFLETETEQGHISRTLEKKVLDVLIAALTDTLTEHPELVAAAREGLGGGAAPHLPPGNNMLQQILEMTPEEKEAATSSLYAAFKEQSGHHYQTHLGGRQHEPSEPNRTKLNMGNYKP